MTGRGLIRKTLRDQRGTMVGLGLTNVVLAVLMILLYPSVAAQFADIELPAFYEIFFGEASIASPEGFLAAEYFSWVPIIAIVIAVIAGTGTIAGEESDGTLELLMAQPITRRAVLIRKSAGLAIALGTISMLALPGIVAGGLLVEFELGFERMLSACVLMVLQVWFFLAASILASAALPTRATAAVAVTALTVLAYFTNLVAKLIPATGWLSDVNPFGWADYPAVLLHGPQWPEALLLLGLTDFFVLAAAWSFERRDIGVSAWPLVGLGRRRNDRETANPDPPNA
jgi:ABC-2 type transport system permease protein